MQSIGGSDGAEEMSQFPNERHPAQAQTTLLQTKNTRSIIFDGICTMAMNAFFAGRNRLAIRLGMGRVLL
jgi:hypothetical protein